MALNFISMSIFTIVFCFVFQGIAIRLSMIFFSILAFPVYLGIYAIELMLASNEKENSYLQFNIPTSYPKRYFTDIVAAIISLCYLYFGLNAYSRGNKATFVQDFFHGRFLSFPWSLIPLILLFVLYVISYKTPKDEANVYDKIKNISFPSVLVKIIKDIFENKR